MDTTKTYKPVDCSFYDELELIALRGGPADIYYDNSGTVSRKNGVIRSLESKSGAEFMILTDGTEIRLDYLISINGKAVPPDSNSCDVR